MRIGVAKETEARETRVAATPETVKKFAGLGAEVVVAKGAGLASGVTDADYAAEFRQALEEAVRIRLRADVPVGCYLSGGLDSCSVLGLAARPHPSPMNRSGGTGESP